MFPRTPPAIQANQRAKSVAPENIAKEYNCKACSASDSLDNMVLCDNPPCGSWFHYSCVGVDSLVDLRPWMCATCTQGFADAARTSATTAAAKQSTTASHISRCSKASTSRHLQLELRKLDEERRLAERKEQSEREFINKKYQILSLLEDANSDSEEDDVQSIASVRGRTNSWINDARSNVQSTKLINRPSIDKVRPHQRTAAGENREEQKSNCSDEVTNGRTSGSNFITFESPNGCHAHFDEVRQEPQRLPVNDSVQRPPQLHNRSSDLQQQPTYPQQHSSPVDLPFTASYFGGTNQIITRNHLAARHSISKELKSFSGDPDEWPLFIRSFERSTELCGFSSEENLMRLQQSLKGKALESVKSLLIQPDCVPRVISTLKMLFGRPEFIIETLMNKIQATPPPKADKLDSIVNFAIAVQNLCATIEATGCVLYLSNPTLLRELVDKLPPAIRLNWAMYTQTLPIDNHTLSNFSSWLYKMAEAVNLVSLPSTLSNDKQPKSTKDKGFLHVHSQDVEENKYSSTERNCCICSGYCPSIAKCKRFENLSLSLKWAFVRDQRLCRRCLSKHGRQRCKVETVCGKNNCIFKHHRLLHNDEKDSRELKPQTEAKKSEEISPHHDDHFHHHNSEDILFRVIPVTLYGNDSKVNICALFDEGSSVTLLDEEVARQLKIKGIASPLRLRWTADEHRCENDSEVMDLKISGISFKNKKYTIEKVHTVKSLQLPQQSVDNKRLQTQYDYLKGLPISSFANQRPRLLIGINNWKLGLPLKYKEGAIGQPVATKTRLGWAIHGCLKNTTQEQVPTNGHCNFHICECEKCDDGNLQDLVKQFLCYENFGVSKPDKMLMSVEEERALALLKELTRRKEGYFETGLLWKNNDIELPDSFEMAYNRFKSLQKRMTKDPELAKVLQNKIQDYLSKGYARKLSSQEAKERRQRSWYLPIFPVMNPNKPSKLRIVWDAAAKVRGMSLNSFLMKGPDQLTSLISVLYKFREKKVAICGDIMEMFHQVKIRVEDQHSQLFLWCEGEDKFPETYAMTVMTFGATCSPACAQYVKNENAKEFSEVYPEAVRAILENHYVDDLLVSVDTQQEAVELAKNIRFVHSQGGFYIRNWVSNSTEVVKALQSSNTDLMNLNIDPELISEKVLGMWWCTTNDMFIFKPTAKPRLSYILSGSCRPTKRDVLRLLMTIFDPLGLIAHFLMYLKVLLQDIWRSGIGWDEKIQDKQNHKWLNWIHLLPKVENLQIPRCYITKKFENQREMQLHIFCDASEDGYAAVAYLRCSDGCSTEVSLIGAKTRVAPIKSLSIPRLELQAATLGARLSKSITQSHSIAFTSKVFWSDSKNVLCWLRSDHRKYKQFVAFRVSEILELSDISEWRWVSTKENVADEATKWTKIPEFCSSNRWFVGPSFLLQPPETWPIEKSQPNNITDELRSQYVNIHVLCYENLFVADRFSEWRKLLRSCAFLHRFVKKLHAKVKLKQIFSESFAPTEQQLIEIISLQDEASTNGPLNQMELQQAERTLLKEVQLSTYRDEIDCFSKNKPVSKISSIYKLCPYLDEYKLIRASGRIELSKDVSHDFKHPILLSGKHHITRLIMLDYHERYKHQHHETVLNEIRQRFHITNLRTAFNSVRRSCQNCKNLKAQPSPPIMAQLPPARLASFSRPFSFVGVDYFGPLNVTIHRRIEKRWGVLFTCLTTRGIHIEVAHSLSTDSCILAIRNFTARRGMPIEFHCDNGTNFRGAERELKEAYEQVNKEKLIEAFTSAMTKWVFIPPGSPHMGGSWERLVRSVKSTLARTMLTRNPSDELLRSSLIEVESIINSRPLTYLPITNEHEDALTPNHFLLGSSSGMKPIAIFNDDRSVLKKNWMTSQQYADHFWKRWVQEYLPTITRRSKWFTPAKPIEIGSLVIIVDPNSPRNSWPKGRVIDIKLSKDGQVRSATIQTSSGVYERPAVKLAVLDVGVMDLVKSTSPSGHTGGEC